MVDWVLLVIALLGSAAMTGLIRRFALHNKILDIPLDRSAHREPIPTGGGVAIVCSFYLALGIFYARGEIADREALVLLGGLVVAILGFYDDMNHLRIGWRLGVQFLAAMWAVGWLGDAPEIQVAAWNINIPVIVHILIILALVWLLNLYNFMDGIDGLAATEACSVTLVSFLLVMNSSDQVVTLLSALLFAVTVGFLSFNWPPARIFMGDSGSGFLGFSLGILALFSMQHGSMNLWAWLLLLGVFVIDATYTLVGRILGGLSWYAGHNTHAYQQAAIRFGSHKQVTLGVLAINLLWLAPLAWLANSYPQLGVFITLVGLTPLLLLAKFFAAGKIINPEA